MTFRPLNECDDCGHTWHPRGHDVAKRCPHCGHGHVLKVTPEETEGSSSFLGTLGTVVCFLWAGVLLSPILVPAALIGAGVVGAMTNPEWQNQPTKVEINPAATSTRMSNNTYWQGPR